MSYIEARAWWRMGCDRVARITDGCVSPTKPCPDWKHWVRTILFAAICGTMPLEALHAEVRALVIGVDTYTYEAPLKGAVNDARLISQTLRDQGARVVTLLNKEATAPRIWQEWSNLQADAPPGTVLVFTYAGHGTQVPEQIPGDEDDGKDELIALAGYRAGVPLSQQRDWFILDNEWRSWIAKASAYRVITLFDACHSGSLTRAVVNPQALSVRSIVSRDSGSSTSSAGPVQLLGASPSRIKDDGLLAHEIYLGGSSDKNAVIEVVIGSQPHGALSYHFARALASVADSDRNGQLTVGELGRYLMERVESEQNAQLPVIRYALDDAVPLFDVSARASAASRWELPEIAIDPTGAPRAVREAVRKQPGVRVVTSEDAAQLIWRSEPYSGFYSAIELLALTIDPQHVNAAAIAGAIRKWRTVESLRRLQDSRVLPLRYPAGLGPFRISACRRGDATAPCFTVTPQSTSPGTGRVTLNLASDGRIQYLPKTPRTFDAASGNYTFEVGEPAGADHFLILDTQDPSLDKWVRARDGSPLDGDEFLRQLERSDLQYIGLATMYTCDAAGRTCGR